MISRKIAWSMMVAALALWGCNGDEELPDGVTFPERDFVCPDGETPPCATTEPFSTDAQRTREPGDELDNETRTYVINALIIPEASGDEVLGFNLDNIDSGDGGAGETCEEQVADYVSPADPNHVGVDNALVSILSQLGSVIGDIDLNQTVADQLASGDLLILLTVSGIDSFSYDPEVTLQLALGALPDGAEIELQDGKLAPGQTFEIETPLGPAVQGDIFDGRLRAQVSKIDIPINAGDFSLDLSITNPQVRFDISENGLENGVIGGVLTVDDLVAAIADIPAAGDFCNDPPQCTAARSILEGLADVSPDPADPEFCTALSVGLGFEATSTSN